MMLSVQAARMGSVHTTLRKIGHRLLDNSVGGPRRYDQFTLFRAFASSTGNRSKSSLARETEIDDFEDSATLVSTFAATSDVKKKVTTTPPPLGYRSEGLAAAASVRADLASLVASHDHEPWAINLHRGNDNRWLMSPRDETWFTGLPPRVCPGVDENGIIRSLPLPNLSAVTRQAAKEYFDNSWTLYETLFAGLKGEEGFYRPPVHGLRHPQIFYYGHTACLYINKLRVAGVLNKPVHAYFEAIFEVGVDEMLWDDMNKNDMLWPMVSEVHEYRKKVYETVVEAIMTHESLDDSKGPVRVDQSHPMWALFMGFEHDRIHLETSSVLFRETPLHLVQKPENWPLMHPSAYNNKDSPTSHPQESVHYPPNRMVPVNQAAEVNLGKPPHFPSFGWDNEYGERNMEVPPFAASEHMVTNGEFWQFVADGGYRTKKYWCDDGWAWRTHRNMKWPFFWETAGPAGSFQFTLRTIFEVISMPWDWPVDVNYYEAKAYCRWKTEQDQMKAADSNEVLPYRLLTEAEHHIIRHREHNLDAARQDVDADKVMATSGIEFAKGKTGANLNLAFGSQNPVNYFDASHTGHRDTTGSAWEWTEDHFNPLKGFEVHHVYDDFSTPCFDGKHSMIVGGSFMSTGDEASVFARFHFRPHFLQHSGFRLVTSEGTAPATHLFAGNFEGQVAARDAALSAQQNPLPAIRVGGPSGGDSNVYETDASLNMYLGLHFPASGEKENVPPILPHDNAPNHAIRFPQRVVQLLNSLKPVKEGNSALDIGCAVGGSSFELAKSYDRVDAFDFSESFVRAAKRMQALESIRFRIPVEAELFEEVTAVHEKGITPDILSKVNFFTGDACAMDEMLANGQISTYDGVVISNLLCRLPDPMACLDSLPKIVNKEGVVVMVTPFSWLPEFTPRSKWLGGFYDPVSKEAIRSKAVLQEWMEERGFVKVHESEIPLVIREHQRKYQYIVSEATGWKKVQ